MLLSMMQQLLIKKYALYYPFGSHIWSNNSANEQDLPELSCETSVNNAYIPASTVHFLPQKNDFNLGFYFSRICCCFTDSSTLRNTSRLPESSFSTL